MSKIKKHMIMLCPCGSHEVYSACCGLYLLKSGPNQNPLSPEALMRSRYTAYTQGNVGYIVKTMSGKALLGFNKVEARKWSRQVTWVGLQVIKTSAVVFNRGYVEFIASFIENGKLNTLHEVSEFICEGGVWFYVGGDTSIN